MFVSFKKTAIVVFALAALVSGWFLLGSPTTTRQIEDIVGLGITVQPHISATQLSLPCASNGAVVMSPYGASTSSSSDCGGTLGAATANTQPLAMVAPTESDYRSARKLRTENMTEGLKKGDLVAAADTVFTSRYCAGLKPADRANNACDESDAGRKQALVVLKRASDKGDAEASFAFARALVLDNSPSSRQQAISVLQAMPVKSTDAVAFLEYLKHL